MQIAAPTHGSVFHVVANMRDVDRREIYGIRNHENPFLITQEVMARPEMTWVMGFGGEPAVVLGGVEMCHGVWSIHCFGTNNWSKLAIPLTRFVKKTMLPLVIDGFGAHRLEADSHEAHTEAHRWMELCGAHREGIKRGRGKDGSDYVTFVILGREIAAKATK